jgi:glycogen(starch) synthase
VIERAPGAEPTFLFVGALDSHKQPDLAVAALAEFRRVHGAGKLTFIGPSGPESRARLKQLAGDAGVADQVGFLGRVSDDQLDAEFAAATALLCTSRIEGFGLPGVEALLRGVPVIAVDTPAARETVGSAATLVESSAEAIAAAMAAPIPVSDVTRQTLIARFSLRATADSLWAVYERALG